MQLSVATWNVNSVRLRLDHLARMVEELRPDVICLQETKVVNDLFPRDAIAALGYPHIAVHGMKSYNGVAVLSRLPLDNVRTPGWCGKEDCRHLIADVAGVEVHCLYIPAGGDIPDPEVNEKFAHKLQFLDELTAWYGENYRPGHKAIITGDFNIAPLETDVWSHKQLLKIVSHTPIEVEHLGRLQASVPWIDAVRRIIPPEEKLYTWWSYRSPNWETADRGRRLDHLWVTPALEDGIRAARVLKDCRSWQPPSDHVPVMVTLEV